MQRSNRTKVALATAAVAAASSLAQLHIAAAATHTWNGSTDANWNTAANWTSNAIPNANTEDVVFNTPGAGNLSVTASAGTLTIRSLTFSADATNPVTINVGTAGQFIINGQTGDDVTVTTGAHKIQGTGTTTVSELKLNATDFNIASGASLELAARLAANATSNNYSKSGAGTLLITAQNGSTGGWNFTGGTFTINGGVVVLRSSQAMGNSSNRVAINSGAAMQLENNSYVATNGVVALNNGGTLRAVGATSNRAIGAGTGQIFLTGASSIDANDGTMTLTQDINGAGSFTKIGAGTLILNDGGANTVSTYTGNTTIATGTLALGATGTFGASPRVEVQSGAALNVTAAGYNVPASQTLAGNGTVYGNVNLAGANSAIAPGSSPGTLTFANDLTLTSGQLKLDLSSTNDVGNGVNDLIVVGGNLNLNGNTLLNITRTAGSVSGTYTVLQYAGSLAGAGTLTAPVVRQGLTVDTSTGGVVKVIVGAGAAGNIKWKGNGSDSTWQTNGSTIWDNSGAADKYFDWDDVTFSDDLGSNSPNVTVSGTVVPNSISVNNSAVDYTFGGSGAIVGVNTLTKSGSRSATFSNSGGLSLVNLNANGGTLVLNTPTTASGAVTLGGGALRLTAAGNFAGTTINSGTLEIGDGATAGSVTGSITNNGSVILNNPGDNTYGNTQSGTGSVEKKGTGIGTLSGDLSGLTGDFKVSAGVVRPTLNGSFGATTGTGGSVTVVNNAQIDLGSGAGTNSLNFGTRQFNVVGAGPDGSGVIINSHATRAQQNAFQNVRLTGDATFGGTSRFDIRSSAGTLDLAGNTLHKVGNMQLSLVGVTTVTDGNIHVHNGTFSVETTTNIAGNGTVTFDGGTTLQLFNLSGNVTRPMVTNGAITINNASGTASIVGSPIRLGGDATVIATSGTPGNLTLNGAITDDGGSRSITKNNANMLILGGANTYGGSTTVNAGTLQVTPSGSVGAGLLANADSTLVDFVAGRSAAVKVSQITIGGAGTVDLHDNDMIIGSATAMSSVETLVRNARNGGAWNAPGLTSSTAAANSTTGIGVISGAEYNSAGGTGVFSGKPYAASDTLVKYTWNGDANLDGRVTFDDYVKIDTGFNTGLTGWFNGDFNYSGAVTFDDYVLIDIAFNQQNGTLGRAVDWISGDDRSAAGLDGDAMQTMLGHLGQFGSAYGTAFLAAVPEPSALLALGVPAIATVARRRRRRA